MFQFNDGGRTNSGFKGAAGDCVVRAIAIATERPYQEVYDALFEANKRFADEHYGKIARRIQRKGGTPRDGTYRQVYEAYLKSLGFVWKTCMRIGTGCKVHLTSEELPKGRLVCRVSKHLVAVIDGVINDTWDCSRGGSRCVYGYYIKEA